MERLVYHKIPHVYVNVRCIFLFTNTTCLYLLLINVTEDV